MSIDVLKTRPVAQPDAVPAARRGTQIRLDGISKYYGPVPAVDDVSLTIEAGEFMTFLGPSGSGKTTTLNLIAGFERLSAGSICLDAVDVSALPPHRRNLGMLFQNYALFPHMNVARNIGYPLRERRMGRDEIARLVRDVLALVQLQGRDDAYPAQLSGGQQQRVALARAIVFEPRALLLDEPLSALDRNLRAALQLEIRRIHRELGATFVFVTHDQDEAMTLSDRIALFNRGRIVQIGSPETLYNRPETLFAARFLGESNVFLLGDGPIGATVAWEDARWRVEPGTVASSVSGGAGAALVVRPEAVGLATDAASVPEGANAVRGRVLDVEYLGAHRTIILALGGEGLPGRARIAAAGTDYAPGDAVLAWWRPVAQRIVAIDR